MIHVSGKAKMTFTLPTDIETAFSFYRDVNRILPFLPRIQFIKSFSPDHLRLCYLSRELNAYDVRIYCDVLAIADPEAYFIRLMPENGDEPVNSNSGFNSTVTHGRYQSESYFYPEGDQTRLEYWIELAAELPKPWAVKIIPDSVMSSVANSIASYRIQEIATGFIKQSAAAMAKWEATRFGP